MAEYEDRQLVVFERNNVSIYLIYAKLILIL